MKHRLYAALAVFALVVAGCTRTTGPVAPPADAGPEPNTPENVLRRFEWAVDQRDLRAIAELVTEDFLFLSAGTDSMGNPTREIRQRRDDLLQWLEELLVGSPGHPPAADVTLRFEDDLVPRQDPRPGYVDSLFQVIWTPLEMEVVWQDGMMEETTGHALFFLARGDTVLVPEELGAAGFESDPSRWWMTRWDDETAPEVPRTTGLLGTSPPVRISR